MISGPGGPVPGRGKPGVDRPSTTAGLLPSLVELILPRACIGCGRGGSRWCLGCLATEFDPVPHRPDPCPPGLPLLAACAAYTGSMRQAILAAKERDRRDLDRLLGALLACAVGTLVTADPSPPTGTEPVWLVPVPASPSARRRRGRDHVRDWTMWAVRWLRAAAVPAHRVPALRRTSVGLDSVGLDAGQRAVNLSGAFALERLAGPPPGTRVVLVDDIVTTGATLVAATDCLTAGFVRTPLLFGAAVVAATQRHANNCPQAPGNTGRSLAHPDRSH